MELNKETLDKVRNIEGFPTGKDEDIIKLSDPPYYTACPNPFINEFIEKNSKPYDEEADSYTVEPYTADVSEGKEDPIYNAHSYHTKVPPKAIMRYILHYTKPGDIIFDGFCGSGMTGVASLMCDSPETELQHEFEKDINNIQWGSRYCILNDISPIASFISKNYNLIGTNNKANEIIDEAIRTAENVSKEVNWVYKTQHCLNGEVQTDISNKPILGEINYTIWSDVLVCPNCNGDIIFWDNAVDEIQREVKDEFKCEKCNAIVTKSQCERKYITYYDSNLDKSFNMAKQVPVVINYTVGKKRYNKKPDYNDLKLIEDIENKKIDAWIPMVEVPFGDNTNQPIRSHGLMYSHHYYTRRNLFVLSKIYEYINQSQYSNELLYFFTAIRMLSSKNTKVQINKYFKNGQFFSYVTGTLYIPSINIEGNVISSFRNRIKTVSKLYQKVKNNNKIIVTNQSATQLANIPANGVDYIFTDPPFGNNLMYSELNFLWESWLKVYTNNKNEAIMNKSQKKGLNQYQELMEKCFVENYRILKPGRWMTVEFHNSQNSVWNAIQEAILKAGFVIANVKTLDKKQGSFKQVTTTTAVKQDLIISAYKPKSSFVERFLTEAGTEEGVWDYIREHLSKLPVTVENSGMLDVIAERQNYLLYDSMVAFHIQKGATVPLGAADFYLGLKQRFPERDGMYFLPGQVSIYDAKRITQELNEQMSLLVLDEKTAIQWLHIELATPQTYQDIQPKFLQELKQLKYEKMPELRELLEENFLQDEHEKWYVPDVNKQSDLEKLRDKKLLREFDEYRNSKGKLKVFRAEAIRAGFKHCWREKDYKTIVNIGERMPEAVVQEDPSILMYYDNALTRIGD